MDGQGRFISWADPEPEAAEEQAEQLDENTASSVSDAEAAPGKENKSTQQLDVRRKHVPFFFDIFSHVGTFPICFFRNLISILNINSPFKLRKCPISEEVGRSLMRLI